MKVRDWEQIETLFHEALNIRAEERPAYLAGVCKDDEALRREVESLLRAFEKDGGFMDKPALSLGWRVISEEQRGTLEGKTIGPYRIRRLLGQGGGGEVYLAEDVELNRSVALKFFTSQVMDDGWVRRQSIKEARAVAGLEHPNICAVHGIEEIDGYHFIVMQYVEGETLSSLASKDALELKQILDLAEQITCALEAAHAHGIIHRDIKPQNIVVTASGQIKVLDFGLAKVVQPLQNREQEAEGRSLNSQTGLVVGTVAYMSPEQLRAEELDFRSDIFSFGVMLYELISGTNPYRQPSEAETISATLTRKPQPLTHRAAKIPPTLNAVVQRCLEKEKERRYQSAAELGAAIRSVRDSSYRQKLVTLRRAYVAALLLLFIVGVVGLRYAYLYFTRAQTIAVLPLRNESEDPNAEYISKGLTASLVSQLSGLSGLRVKSPLTVPGASEGRLDFQGLGRDLKADALVMGRIVKRGDALLLQMSVIRPEDGAAIWTQEFPVQMTAIQTLHKEIAEQIVRSLEPRMTSTDRRRLSKIQTDNAEAYTLYLKARYLWDNRSRQNIEQAIDYYKKATELDPLFSQAWAGLADAYMMLPTAAYGSARVVDVMPKARAAALKAIDNDPLLAEGHVSLAMYKLRYEWNWAEAERELKLALELNPESSSAYFWYSNLLIVTGRAQDAIAISEKAQELDPFAPNNLMNLGRAHYNARNYDAALERLAQALAEKPDNVNAKYVLGYVYIQKKRYAEAIQALKEVSEVSEDKKWLAAAPLGYAYAKAGMREDALELLKQMAAKPDLPVQEQAIIYIGLGDKDRAFELLSKSYEEHFPTLIYLTSDPIFDGLRSDARFNELARKINLTP
ncbi:MAG TPA: protein kinase [Pyrinomonadaceae bacterium]|nr:protein kinase [Pyrinomonadaceae bacterium]